MSELKRLHPYLYKRVQLKGVTFTLLGLALIIPQHLPKVGNYISQEQANSTRLYEAVSYDIWGAIFTIIGLGILFSLKDNRSHTATRPWLVAAYFYAVFWLFALLLAVVTGNARSASIVILWGYLTYNLWVINHDTGWEGAALVKAAKERRRAG